MYGSFDQTGTGGGSGAGRAPCCSTIVLHVYHAAVIVFVILIICEVAEGGSVGLVAMS